MTLGEGGERPARPARRRSSRSRRGKGERTDQRRTLAARSNDIAVGLRKVLADPAWRFPLSSRPLPVWLAAGGISAGMAFRAFDGLAGQACAALINGLLFYTALLCAPAMPGFWRRAARPLACAGAAVLWALVATIGVSGGMPDYLPGKLLSLAAAFCALMTGAMMARGRRRLRAILDWLLLVNMALFALALAARQAGIEQDTDLWQLTVKGRFAGFASNANVSAVIAACCALIAFVRMTGRQRTPAWMSARLRHFPIHLLFFTLSSGVVLITGSRFTLVLLTAVLLVYLVHWMRRKRVTRWRLMLAGGAVFVQIALAFLFSAVVMQRYAQLEAGWDDRFASWAHLWDVAWQQPWLGYGLGSFPSVNAHFLTTPRYAQANWAVNSAHNIGLQLMLQGGMPYTLLMIATFGVGGWQVARIMRQRWTRDTGLVLAMMGLLLAAGMIDLTLDMPAPLSLFLFLAGLLWGQALDRREIRVAAADGQPFDHEGTIGVGLPDLRDQAVAIGKLPARQPHHLANGNGADV
ncbi:O-antigen ligase family protein [Sphingobium olei]|uniref:O-antigen ligase family protein n=1 Tax=Sphingobium olei TaxID=420955 RepID=UPI003D23F0C0